MRRRAWIWVVGLSLGCGPATFYEAEPLERADADGAWEDNAGAHIPPPISEGWPIRGGDPEGEHQRVACIEEIDRSRAHISRAIASARASHEHERLSCLSSAAGELKSLRTHLAAPSLFEQPLPPALACPASQKLVHEARRCR
ncbi:MAG: hypothetical protein IPM79_27540 [Polyangiaceae bacterium]|nr:hypothetical protein [Polyangiaceae bacterium]